MHKIIKIPKILFVFSILPISAAHLTNHRTTDSIILGPKIHLSRLHRHPRYAISEDSAVSPPHSILQQPHIRAFLIKNPTSTNPPFPFPRAPSGNPFQSPCKDNPPARLAFISPFSPAAAAARERNTPEAAHEKKKHNRQFPFSRARAGHRSLGSSRVRLRSVRAALSFRSIARGARQSDSLRAQEYTVNVVLVRVYEVVPAVYAWVRESRYFRFIATG